MHLNVRMLQDENVLECGPKCPYAQAVQEGLERALN